ncbi:MAG: MtrB/PioB family decaheme-associated outer membrane protein [Nitrospira sp.]|nr:MtrB/PioB family decaheme-associated outer membrane protein [Nitrospira sp.]MDH4369670.1 MtrB/PioB family decaheme-associated outer membrane protein [Nitrospira sp.]MDH5496870.1 MtrB/PioB family decaheme-associated outer membrane protein [Nitrospira sp.]MDH5725692.1 MtrB/PioB family decaheme-associated outer membrane protein [Nitrospira sp.]
MTPHRHRVNTLAVAMAGIVAFTALCGGGQVRGEEIGPPPPHWKESLPFRLEGEVEAGFQTLSGNTGSPTFFEYRDLAGKPTIPNLRLKAEDSLGTRFLELGGRNMTRTDGSFFLHAGQYNALQFDFGYDRLPHVIGLNRTTIYSNQGGGKFALPGGPLDPVTEGAFNAVPGTTVGQRNAIASSVNSLLQPTSLGFQTDTAHMGLRYLLTPDLTLTANYSRREKSGTSPFGGVIGTPGGPVVEFAAPRDERIHEMGATAEYAKDWYQLRMNYTASLFENGINQVEWDNVCGNGAPCGNLSGFGRAATMPNNLAHTFSGAGGASLPWWYTRLTGNVSYALWRQDQTFMPVSTLSSRNFSDAGATSPKAAMDVLLASFGLTSRPVSSVTLTARYRYYHLDNNTPIHTFTSALFPGDTGVGQTNRTTPISFRKQNVSANAAWRMTNHLTAKIGYEWERWGRSFREAAESDEHIGKAALDYRPTGWAISRLTYSHGVRTIGADGYVQVSPITAVVLPQFRKFDQADRTRDKVEWFLHATPVDPISFSLQVYAQQDHFFNTSYGLQQSRAYGYSGDVTWTPFDRLSFIGGYAHDDYQSRQQNCHVAFNPLGPGPCDPTNTYFSRPRDLLDTWHMGMYVIAIPQRLDLSLDYRYTFGRSKYGMSGTSGGAVAGDPVPMPDIKNVFHVVQASARYRVTLHWTLKMVYLYERYRESDFTVDNVTPSLANVVVDGFTTPSASDVRSVLIPIQHPAYEAHFMGFSVAYQF